MPPSHSRVAPGSLVLLEATDTHSDIAPEFMARGPAQAMARLKAAKTTVICADPTKIESICAYAMAQTRPIVIAVAPDLVDQYRTNAGKSARTVSRQGLFLLGDDLSALTDPIVVFGDLHQCWRTYLEFRDVARRHYGDNVLLVAAGDVFDKGGNGPEDVVTTATLLMSDWAAGNFLMVAGNHDIVLAARLSKALHAYATGTELPSQNRTPRALMRAGVDLATQTLRFLQDLPLYIRLAPDALVVHAAWDPALAASAPNSKRFMENCLYGPRPPRGQPRYDERGKYVLVDWAPDYRGQDTVIHGHHDRPEVSVQNKVIGLDTGCVYGNCLTGYLVGADPTRPEAFLAVSTQPADLRVGPIIPVPEPSGELDPIE